MCTYHKEKETYVHPPAVMVVGVGEEPVGGVMWL